MPFDRPHIEFSHRKSEHQYTAPPRNIQGGNAPRIREEHGAELLGQLRAAFHEVEQQVIPDGFGRGSGAYYEVELRRGAKAEILERKTDQIEVGATKIDPATETISTVLFVPDSSVPALERILQDYATGPLTTGRTPKPQRHNVVEPIEAIRRARLLSFWTDDPDRLPTDPQERLWWEVWVRIGGEDRVAEIFGRMECRVADRERWLWFPEVAVVVVYARRADMELAISICDDISELRRGSDTPNFFLGEAREAPADWVENFAERVVWPANDVPRVCLLDTGVNRGHILIEPALSEGDLFAVNPDWVVTDNERESHGTEMAGLALHGDLFARLQDGSTPTLTHRLESVRIMPADGFPPNEPARLGSITLSAVALSEIENPNPARVFCMAITNEDHSGERATSWSACIDRAAVGKTAGDEEARRRRLFVLSAGNIPPVMRTQQLEDPATYPIEDPAQSWNGLTIGGYTDKIDIDPTDRAFDGYTALAAAGDVSPYSRNSVGWKQGKTPIKPELLLEAGNRARSASGADLLNCPSLELLTTGSDVDSFPIVNFAATSAASALAARMAAQLHADHPSYWPETIRALMVHSAAWTPPMQERLNSVGARERVKLLRAFGYGVPSYERATASANNELAILAQQEIQPFEKRDGSVKFKECHYYPLPWPREVLERFGEAAVALKVTLSYFVEPNPGRSAAIDPQNYQSFGLRFDLRRARETLTQFRGRVNAEERGERMPTVEDEGWVIGPTGIAAGSLHSDVWRGTAAQLASRDTICVKPVSGWWKERRNTDVCHQKARYALIVTLIAPSIDVDLHTPISASVGVPVDVGVAVEVIA